MEATVKGSKCVLVVEGIDMKCPLCGLMVYSGTRHECDGGIATNEPFSLLPQKPAPKKRSKR